jgi:competence protein ComEC
MGAKSQQVTIGSVSIGDKPVFGNMLVSVARDQQIVYGDHLVFSCSIQIPRPFSGFAYDRYLQAKGTLALCRFPHDLDRVASKQISVTGSVLSFKNSLVEKMKQVFPEPHASFLFGLVFGGSVGLDKDIQNDFSKTGMTHILAASGFNVSLFTFVFYGFITTYLGRKRGAVATAVLLVAYVIMAGATAAVIRAAVFGMVLLAGSAIGRRAHVVNALLFTASLMLFWNPRWLLDDVGFQLSFVAFAAIMFVAPKLEERLVFIPETFGIRDALAGSLSAIFLTLPIILWQFGSVSLIAPFANVFVLPLLPLLMFYTIAILPIAWLSIPVAKVIAIPSLFGSKYILSMISIFASPSFASVSVPSAQIVAVVVAILMGIGSVVYFRKT